MPERRSREPTVISAPKTVRELAESLSLDDLSRSFENQMHRQPEKSSRAITIAGSLDYPRRAPAAFRSPSSKRPTVGFGSLMSNSQHCSLHAGDFAAQPLHSVAQFLLVADRRHKTALVPPEPHTQSFEATGIIQCRARMWAANPSKFRYFRLAVHLVHTKHRFSV